VDYTFKYRGFATVGEAAFRDSTPETGRPFDQRGVLLQASYAWKAPGIAGASFWEVAARYAWVDPSTIVSRNAQKEWGAALNYYYNRHSLKAQLDWRRIEDDAANSGAGTRNQELRLQAQFIF
jgi:predicted porin